MVYLDDIPVGQSNELRRTPQQSWRGIQNNKDGDGICFAINCKDDDRSEETFLSRLAQDELDRNIEEEKRSLYIATTRASDMPMLTFKE